MVNCVVGSGIFGMPALAAAMLGPAALLAYAVCGLLVGLVGLCFAEAGSRVHAPGGLYAYVATAFGPMMGWIAGTLLWFANGALSNAAVASLLADTLARPIPILGDRFARAAFLVVLYSVLAVLNIRGVRVGVRLSESLTIAKLAPLVVLVLVGACLIDPENLRWPAVPPLQLVAAASVLMFFAFMGVEAALSTNGEVVNPARTVPRALLLALTLVVMLYMGLQTVAQGVLGPQLPDSKAPLVATASAVFGRWGERGMLVAIVLSTAGFFGADILCTPRVLYALANDGQLPRGLAYVHPRFLTPATAIATYAAVCAALALSGTFRQLALVASSGTLLLYLLSCLSLMRLRSRGVTTGAAVFVAPGGSLVPVLACGVIAWLLASLQAVELFATLGLVAVAALVYVVRTARTTRRA